MLTQSHLCPFTSAVQPVLWDFDGSMRLFPPPDVLVVAEAGPVQSCIIDGVRCVPLLHISRVHPIITGLSRQLVRDETNKWQTGGPNCAALVCIPSFERLLVNGMFARTPGNAF
jgi:hypothetical protein